MKHEAKDPFTCQLEREQAIFDNARFYVSSGSHTGKYSSPLRGLVELVFEPLVKAFEAQELRGRNQELKWIFEESCPERMSFITAKVVLDYLASHEGDSAPYTPVCVVLGRTVRDDMRMRRIKALGLHKPFTGKLAKYKERGREYVREVMALSGVQEVLDDPFGDGLCLKLGKYLVGRLIEETGAVVSFRMAVSGKTRRRLRLSDEVEKFLSATGVEDALASASLPPMLVPPLSWTNESDGGYLLYRRSVVTREHAKGHYDNTGPLPPKVADTLNKLQQVPWTVNREVFGVAQKFMSEYGFLPGADTAEVPAMPTPDDLNEEERASMAEYRREVNVENRIRRKLRATLSRIMSVGREVLGRDAIYFPWMIDWRGRFYPMSSDFHVQGCDVARGCLQFAESCKVTEEGVDALAHHAANAYGLSSSSIADRERFISENWADIERSIENPMKEEFWQQASDPFTFLAAVRELAAADGNPNYESNASVEIDGSNNAIQWLSVLSGSEPLAVSTNVLPSPDGPKDLYALAGAVVLQDLIDDRMGNNPVDKEMAKYILAPLGLSATESITADEVAADRTLRKFMKSPTMTSCYGATEYGIFRQMVSGGYLDAVPLEVSKAKVGFWLARRITELLDEILSKPMLLMGWMRGVAKGLAEHDQTLEWTSPMGWRVDHTYAKFRAARLNTVAGSRSRRNYGKKIDKVRQVRSIVPNFIHSLDASHVAAVVTEFDGPLGGIHDCFLCRPKDTESLHGLVRDRFVAIVKTDPLQSWAEQVSPGTITPFDPLDVSDTINSRYFFS